MFDKENYRADVLNAREERLSVAAFNAVVASIGGALQETPRPVDAAGVDATCYFPGAFADDPTEIVSGALHAQLKATRNPKETTKNGVACWTLSLDVAQIRRYLGWGQDFVLVLFIAPSEDDKEPRVEVTPESVVLRKSLYWTFLKGFNIDDARKTNTIYIPKTNVLTPNALSEILASARAGKGRYNV